MKIKNPQHPAYLINFEPQVSMCLGVLRARVIYSQLGLKTTAAG